MAITALAAALLLFPPCAEAKPKSPPKAASKPAKQTSTDGSFSYAVPKGFSAGVPKNAIAGWKNPSNRTTIGVFPVSEARKKALGSALKAAKASRERAAAKGEDWVVSKVYKKTLESGMNWFFYTAHQKGKLQKISGYFLMSGNFYFVSGWVSRSKYGIPSAYAALDTIRPIAAPRGGGRVMKDREEPSLLKQQKEKTKGVSTGVRLGGGDGTGSGTPRMLGGDRRQSGGGPLR